MAEKSSQSVQNAPTIVLSNHLDKFPTLGQKVTFTPAKVDPAWNKTFPPSLCDSSLFVPLAKQVASLLSDSSETGILAGAAKVLKEDYTFPDGKIPHAVSLDVFTRLDDFKDIAEISEFKDVLKEQVQKMIKEMNDKEVLASLKKITGKLDQNISLSPDDVALLSQFGVTTENNTTSVKDTLNT